MLAKGPKSSLKCPKFEKRLTAFGLISGLYKLIPQLKEASKAIPRGSKNFLSL
jgi:hypothetical protein